METARFRAIRAHFGVKLTVMAEMVGASPSTWGQYEGGYKIPSWHTLQRIAKLGVNTHWLLTGEGTMLLSSEPPPRPQEPPLVALRQALEAVIRSKKGDELLIWDEIIRVLERHPSGTMFEDIAKAVSHNNQPALLRSALEGLIKAGMVSANKEQYRLIRLTMTDVHNDGQLRTLMAIKTLIHTFLPAVDTDGHEDKIMVLEIPVERGQGVSAARRLFELWKDWLGRQKHTVLSRTSDVIDVVFCILVKEGESPCQPITSTGSGAASPSSCATSS